VDAGEICRTFHSIGLDIFREEVDQNKLWIVDTTGRLWRKSIRLAAKKVGVSIDTKTSVLSTRSVEKVASLAKTQMAISDRALRRLGRIEPELKRIADAAVGESASDDVLNILHAAEDIRESIGIEEDGAYRNFLTFDDMLFAAAMLLRQKAVRERWAHRWTYVMQDESQDSNPVQDEIAEALCSAHRNYMIVGDPSQAIFGFRGASPERMLAFERTWPGSTTVVMDRNYRSGIEIVDVANRVIANMPPSTVIARSMRCERHTRAFVACHEFEDEVTEAGAIAHNIRKHFEQGAAWKDQAIIIRANSMARAIEVALASAAIPYRIVSGESFFSMPEAAILFGYLRVALGRASFDDVRESLSNPNRFVGKDYFEQLSKLREEQPEADWKALALRPSLGRKQAENVEGWGWLIDRLREATETLAPYQVLKDLVKELSLADWLKGNGDGDNTPAENIEQVFAFAAGYQKSDALLDAVDKILSHKKSTSRSRNLVEVSTIHRYKGREAPIVYMPQLVTGAFPSSRADLLEERRLFYVGVTRAMNELWMSYPRFTHDDVESAPSIFLEEAGVPHSGAYEPGRKIQPVKVGTQMGLLI
jgi:DNA helicase-2/ATP-dependent DNA helicase PcrA